MTSRISDLWRQKSALGTWYLAGMTRRCALMFIAPSQYDL